MISDPKRLNTTLLYIWYYFNPTLSQSFGCWGNSHFFFTTAVTNMKCVETIWTFISGDAHATIPTTWWNIISQFAVSTAHEIWLSRDKTFFNYNTRSRPEYKEDNFHDFNCLIVLDDNSDNRPQCIPQRDARLANRK